MKTTLLISLALVAAVCVTTSCKKKKEGCTDPHSLSYDPSAEVYDGSCKYGGIGGNVTIVAKPQHHGVPIISGTLGHPDSAFVKFNAIESQGTSPAAYNLQIEGEAGEDHVHITGLTPGRYFIYMTGSDSTQSVRGGIPVVITQSTGEMDVIVPVTE